MRKNFLKIGWCVLNCALFTPAVMAQYRFDNWTTDNGLPQNSVRDILQTRDGYLWMTTFDGLVRFDGVRFTVFNKSNSPGIASNRFVNLFEDRHGDLWATMAETGEIVRRHDGQFTTYPPLQSLLGAGYPWVGDDGQGNVVVYFLQFDLDAQGKTYIRMRFEAYRWLAGRFQPAQELNSKSSLPPIMAEEWIRWTFTGMIEGDFWTFTNQRIIRLLKDGGAQMYSQGKGLLGTQPALIFGKGRLIQAVSGDDAGRLWLTNLQSGQNQLLSQHAPENFDVHAGYADSEGNYWFSTYNNGLFRARPQAITSYGGAQGVGFSEIYPLLAGRDGAIWIGAYGGGVFKFKDDVFTQYPPPKFANLRTFIGLVSSLYEDRAGQLWVNGLWRLVDGRYLREPWTNTLAFSQPKYAFTWAMCEDRAGAYWLGTDVGVFRYQNGTLTKFTTNEGLAGNDTKVVLDDGQGGVWLGSYGGLTHYQDGKLTAYTIKDGLPGNTVRSLKLDSDGTLWIGTYDSGLGRFKDGRFTRYSTSDGLFDNGVFQILEDDFGWFWMSSNRGIYRVRKQELQDFADGKIKAITCLATTKAMGCPVPNATADAGPPVSKPATASSGFRPWAAWQ